jgi:hypothetical protein
MESVYIILCQGKQEVALLRKHNVLVETINMADSR